MTEAIRHINWVDLFVIIVLFRICYISFITGFAVEIFKLLGTILAVYVAYQYYTPLAAAMVDLIPTDKLPQDFLEIFVFVVLVLACYLVFAGIRLGIGKFIKTESVPLLNKWAGVLCGAVRAFLLCSIILYAFVISGFEYQRDSVKHSFTGQRLINVAPNTYRAIWHFVGARFSKTNQPNIGVLTVQEDIAR